MHEHRTDGLVADSTAAPRRAVRGLGICDLLEVELDPRLREGMLDEIDATRIAHEQSVLEASAAGARESDAASADRHLRAIAVLDRMRSRLDYPRSGRIVTCGPAQVLSGLVDGATQAAAESLVNATDTTALTSLAGARSALGLAVVAVEWAQTLVEIRELEWRDFEGDDGRAARAD